MMKCYPFGQYADQLFCLSSGCMSQLMSSNSHRDAIEAIGLDDFSRRIELIVQCSTIIKESDQKGIFKYLNDDEKERLSVSFGMALEQLFALLNPSSPIESVASFNIKTSEATRLIVSALAPLSGLVLAARSGQEGLLSQINILNGEAEKHKVELNEIVERGRVQAGAKAAATYSGIFGEESRKNYEEFTLWVFSSAVCVVLALLLMSISIYFSIKYSVVGDARVDFLVSKSLLVAVLSSVAFWCARMARLAKHQQTLNAHRKNALLSFQDFMSTSKDEKIREAILLQATSLVYGAVSTGYTNESKNDFYINPTAKVVSDFIKAGKKESGSN